MPLVAEPEACSEASFLFFFFEVLCDCDCDLVCMARKIQSNFSNSRDNACRCDRTVKLAQTTVRMNELGLPMQFGKAKPANANANAPRGGRGRGRGGRGGRGRGRGGRGGRGGMAVRHNNKRAFHGAMGAVALPAAKRIHNPLIEIPPPAMMGAAPPAMMGAAPPANALAMVKPAMLENPWLPWAPADWKPLQSQQQQEQQQQQQQQQVQVPPIPLQAQMQMQMPDDATGQQGDVFAHIKMLLVASNIGCPNERMLENPWQSWAR